MNYSSDCFELVKASEGCRLIAYRDAVGVWTIGYGHTGPEVVDGLVWSQQQADLQLAADLQRAQEQMERLVKVPLTQGQTDALVDFVFNLGSGTLQKSTLLKLLNLGNYAAVPDQLYRVDDQGNQHGFIFAGGKILPGLVIRRQKEIALWQKQP